jgi:hypothetical protein
LVILLWWLLQDIGEGLVGLLHYQERGQLVAVTSTGSAVILTNSSADKAAAAGAGAGADGWTVLLRLKITNAAAGAGLQVHVLVAAYSLSAFQQPCSSFYVGGFWDFLTSALPLQRDRQARPSSLMRNIH